MLAALLAVACSSPDGSRPGYDLRVPSPQPGSPTPQSGAGTPEAAAVNPTESNPTAASPPTPSAPPTPAPTLAPGTRLPAEMRLTDAFTNREFGQPVAAFPWPSGGLAVVDRAGHISVHMDRQPRRVLLTLDAASGGELGLLSAVLDPESEARPYLYVYYHPIEAAASGRPVGLVSRFPVVNGFVIREDELVIMAIPLIESLHNGGALRFGPDGMLYLGLGDSERPRDAQDLGTLRGKVIRIDVRESSTAQRYRVPPDNPFVGVEGARPEVWVYGLRNPWRMSFAASGVLVVADVGHAEFEEVSVATAGANLGWPVFEGFECRDEPAACSELAGTVTMPLVAYGRGEGCAIIGGELPYLFADYCRGRIWALEADPASDTGWGMRELARTDDLRILSFGTDEAGGILVLTREGPILRLETAPE